MHRSKDDRTPALRGLSSPRRSPEFSEKSVATSKDDTGQPLHRTRVGPRPGINIALPSTSTSGRPKRPTTLLSVRLAQTIAPNASATVPTTTGPARPPDMFGDSKLLEVVSRKYRPNSYSGRLNTAHSNQIDADMQAPEASTPRRCLARSQSPPPARRRTATQAPVCSPAANAYAAIKGRNSAAEIMFASRSCRRRRESQSRLCPWA